MMSAERVPEESVFKVWEAFSMYTFFFSWLPVFCPFILEWSQMTKHVVDRCQLLGAITPVSFTTQCGLRKILPAYRHVVKQKLMILLNLLLLHRLRKTRPNIFNRTAKSIISFQCRVETVNDVIRITFWSTVGIRE